MELLQYVASPASLKAIGAEALAYVSLEIIHFPDSLEAIGTNAFYG